MASPSSLLPCFLSTVPSQLWVWPVVCLLCLEFSLRCMGVALGRALNLKRERTRRTRDELVSHLLRKVWPAPSRLNLTIGRTLRDWPSANVNTFSAEPSGYATTKKNQSCTQTTGGVLIGLMCWLVIARCCRCCGFCRCDEHVCICPIFSVFSVVIAFDSCWCIAYWFPCPAFLWYSAALLPGFKAGPLVFVPFISK